MVSLIIYQVWSHSCGHIYNHIHVRYIYLVLLDEEYSLFLKRTLCCTCESIGYSVKKDTTRVFS